MGDMVVLIPKTKWESIYLDGIRSFPDGFKIERENDVETREISL